MSEPQRYSLIASRVDDHTTQFFGRDNSTGEVTDLGYNRQDSAPEWVAYRNREHEEQLRVQAAALTAFVRGAAARHPMPWTIEGDVVRDREGATVLEGATPDVLALVLKMREELSRE